MKRLANRFRIESPRVTKILIIGMAIAILVGGVVGVFIAMLLGPGWPAIFLIWSLVGVAYGVSYVIVRPIMQDIERDKAVVSGRD